MLRQMHNRSRRIFIRHCFLHSSCCSLESSCFHRCWWHKYSSFPSRWFHRLHFVVQKVLKLNFQLIKRAIHFSAVELGELVPLFLMRNMNGDLTSQFHLAYQHSATLISEVTFSYLNFAFNFKFFFSQLNWSISHHFKQSPASQLSAICSKGFFLTRS